MKWQTSEMQWKRANLKYLCFYSQSDTTVCKLKGASQAKTTFKPNAKSRILLPTHGIPSVIYPIQ